MRYGIVGGGDISGIIMRRRDGVGLRLEMDCKTGNATQSAEQKNFEKMILRMGGRYFVVRSAEDALAYCEQVHNE